MKKSKKIALSAILCAIGVIVLYIGSIVSVLDLTMAAVASLLIILAVIEIGGSSPFLIYIVTGGLSLLILPQKFPAMIYLLFAGIYPIFKSIFERLHYVISWILKVSIFNTGLLILIVLTLYVFHIPDTGLVFNLALIIFGNITFVIYDIALTKMITLYLVKVRSLLRLKNYFEN